jgi:membrane protease YdiL (CAAX protease family)
VQVSNAIYFVVVTVCAPLWEEAIFRGFLLPSLTKYMPVQAAVLVSALGFAGAPLPSSKHYKCTTGGFGHGAAACMLLIRASPAAQARPRVLA